ncbi:MAG: glycosyltransferase family 39 protein [Ardenticatenaceae bacterium]|nr:glycosyltransferase family 39 protein [Anaerolineales bacterium]MCB8938626.1 glycosyltransferase family 39 protein [Ardenticatenaceae bacterium]MCB8973759.1 glycosyltransferase family 39 protein [Ardenticatenaceae bacterium]
MLKRSTCQPVWIMTTLLLAGAALRLFGLNNLSPPGITHDEVANWLIDRSILAGEHAIYFTRAYGHEAGFHYLQTAFVALIGDNVLALRLPAAFCGLLGVAVTFALARKLFGKNVALIAAGLLAVLFWPVFYGRLAFRAISLPLVAGLSAYFWWQAWTSEGVKGRKGVGVKKPVTRSPSDASIAHPFTLSGIFAGLSIHTYMAARAVPIFYGLWLAYLAIFHWREFKQHWRGIVLFLVMFAAVAAPLVIYLQTNPGSEFRLGEVDAPLQALRSGDLEPVLSNGLKLLGMFGFIGDPLWREGVPSAPVFEPMVAVLFYAGLVLCLWRWRQPRYAFLLIWLAVAVTPSLVTINAPSHIRSILILPVLTIIPALVMHSLGQLSTVIRHLSTRSSKILVLTLLLFYAARTSVLQFQTWPNGGDVPFVWQAAFTEMARYLDGRSDLTAASIAGWSPSTMDSPTMTLLRQNDVPPLSHFDPQEGSLILPDAEPVVVIRPPDLPLDPYWETQLTNWGFTPSPVHPFTLYEIEERPVIELANPVNIQFGDELLLLGYEWLESGDLVLGWLVTAVPTAPRQQFIHSLAADGSQLADTYRFDAPDPQGLWFPHWQPGDLILQHLTPPALDQATQLRLGWFDPTTCTPGPCQNLRTEDGAEFVLLELE